MSRGHEKRKLAEHGVSWLLKVDVRVTFAYLDKLGHAVSFPLILLTKSRVGPRFAPISCPLDLPCCLRGATKTSSRSSSHHLHVYGAADCAIPRVRP